MLVALPCLISCKAISSFVHDGEVVAKAGEHKLYVSDVEQYIPKGLPPEDSTRLAQQYINSWATGVLFNDIADRELSKAEKDVSRELDDYRSSLLKYRYEQKYVNQRLDTAITTAQIQKYYEDHIENFKLTIPIVKARFMSISGDSPNFSEIRKKMASKDADDRAMADSIAGISALRFTNYNDAWVDAVTLAREFGMDYLSMLSEVKNGFVEKKDDKGIVYLAHISEMMKSGTTGPVEYFDGRIRDIILSARKQALLTSLERDLLEKARSQEDFVIY